MKFINLLKMKFKKPKFWDNEKKTILSFLLLPFSYLYLALFWINRVLKNSISNKKTTIPVICVGNIYIGGTGKTPLAREIYKIIKSFGKKPAFVKKYYQYLSDEINMLERTGKVYATQNRYTGILLSASNIYGDLEK